MISLFLNSLLNITCLSLNMHKVGIGEFDYLDDDKVEYVPIENFYQFFFENDEIKYYFILFAIVYSVIIYFINKKYKVNFIKRTPIFLLSCFFVQSVQFILVLEGFSIEVVKLDFEEISSYFLFIFLIFFLFIAMIPTFFITDEIFRGSKNYELVAKTYFFISIVALGYNFLFHKFTIELLISHLIIMSIPVLLFYYKKNQKFKKDMWFR